MIDKKHCDHVNDFPVVNSTPGIIQDPVYLLLAKCNFPNKRSTVLVFSTCNTVDLLLVKLHLLFLIFLLIDTKKVNHLHDNNVNTEAKPRWYRVILLYVPLN